ncbi:MAG: Flp family type IVb pilin [Bryobacteraceae bacterium]
MSIALLQQFWQAEDGQDLIEYSLLLALIALVAVTMLTSMGSAVKSIFTSINTTLNGAAINAGG